jgi:UDP-perosamine 4-acetyltransferase
MSDKATYLRKNKITVVGGGGHARVLISILKKNKLFEIIGYTDPVDRGQILDCAYLGEDSALKDVLAKYPHCAAAIGIGSIRSNVSRINKVQQLDQLGFRLPSIISRDAIVNENVNIGKATVIFDGAIVSSGARIGLCSIINTNCTIEHDCQIGDNVHIAPGVTISGEVRIGDHSFVGAGAVITQGLTIGENVTIGAGATVVRDCLVSGTYVGTPAKRIA